MISEPFPVASTKAEPSSESREIEVLLHESSEIQENIRGNSDAMVKVGLFVMPLITGAYLLALGSQRPIDKQFLSSVVCIVASFILLTANGLWLHNLRFAEYKYCYVMPRLYALSGRTGPNYGAFLAGPGLFLYLKNLLFSQLIVISVVAVFFVELLRKAPYSLLSAVVTMSVVFATISTVASTLCGYSVARRIRQAAATATPNSPAVGVVAQK